MSHRTRLQRYRTLRIECLDSRQLLAVDLEGGLAGHWSFDGLTGELAPDTTHQNTGSLVNGAASTLGQVEDGLQLDGVNDYVSLGAAPNLPVTGAVSFAA